MDVDVKTNDDDGLRLLELVSRTQPRHTQLLGQLSEAKDADRRGMMMMASKRRVWVEHGF